MAARRSSGRQRPEDPLDKPLWAIDPDAHSLREKERAPEQKPVKTAAPVEERLATTVRDQLAALKVQMDAAAKNQGKAQAQEKHERKRSSVTGSRADASEQDPESFADLFEPKDEEDVSFEELLNTSKLDWRQFKS